MVKGLGLALPSKGVEDINARDALVQLGIDHAQGCYFVEPMMADAFGAILKSDSRLPAA